MGRMRELSWDEAAKHVIPEDWVGCVYAGMSLGKIGEKDEGLLWLHDKLNVLGPWQKEYKAINVFLYESSLVEQDLEQAIRRRQAHDLRMDEEEYDNMMEGDWLDGS